MLRQIFYLIIDRNGYIDILIHIKFYPQTPSTTAEWKHIAKEFHNKWNFPNCIGALDGKHVLIQPPKECGSYYYNYKGTNSIILMALVDANYEFLYADIGVNGRASDGAAWEQSDLLRCIVEKKLNIPPPQPLPQSESGLQMPFVILSDDAFPLTEYLLKPFPFRNQNEIQRIFSYRLSRARRTVENAFGILSNKFRVLLAPINLSPDKVEKVVLACVAMHNMLRRLCPDDVVGGTSDAGVSLAGHWQSQMLDLQGVPANPTIDAKEMRNYFAQYFVKEGAVPWQNNI